MDAVITGIIAALKANTSLMAVATEVWFDAAPHDATYPFVLVSFSGGTDTGLFQGGWTSQQYRVEGVDEGPDNTRALQLQGLINAALTKESVTVEGGAVVCLRRTSPVLEREVYGEHEEDVYWHAGGVYQVTVT